MIKGKTPEEIRKLFNIVNDFTPEEEVRVVWHCLGSLSDPYPFTRTCLFPGSNQEGKRKPFVCLTMQTDPDISFPSRNGLRIVRIPLESH